MFHAFIRYYSLIEFLNFFYFTDLYGNDHEIQPEPAANTASHKRREWMILVIVCSGIAFLLIVFIIAALVTRHVNKVEITDPQRWKYMI